MMAWILVKMNHQLKYLSAGLMVAAILGLMASMAGANDFLSLGRGSDQPIDLAAKKATARNTPSGKEVTYDGNVRVTQGNLTLTCDKLVVLYDEQKKGGGTKAPAKKLPKDLQTISGIKSITATGNVKIAQEERMAIAGKALFDNAKRTITLTEGPKLWQGPDMLVAHTIIVYLDENRAELRGNGDEIRMRINPGKQKKDKEK
jgi:lipopolysaccharide transport protein LptA